MSESHIVADIRLAHSKGTVRLLRNNVGALKDETGRLVRFGLGNGTSDLIGWMTVTVTPSMVGMKIAVFTALEVKTRTGRPTQEQLDFIALVNNMGGNGAIVRSVEEAGQVLYGKPQE